MITRFLKGGQAEDLGFSNVRSTQDAVFLLSMLGVHSVQGHKKRIGGRCVAHTLTSPLDAPRLRFGVVAWSYMSGL